MYRAKLTMGPIRNISLFGLLIPRICKANIFFSVFLILLSFCDEVISKVSIGLYPKNSTPSGVVAFMLNEHVVTFVQYDGWSIEESIQGFFFSAGLLASEDQRKATITLTAGVLRGIKEKLGEDKMPMTGDDHFIYLPFSVEGEPYMVEFSVDGDTSIIAQFVTGSSVIVDLLIPQAQFRQISMKRQLEIFNNIELLVLDWPSRNLSKRNESCQIYHNSNVDQIRGAKIADASQLLMQHAIKNDQFPTFVINLWYNSARRQFMRRQLERSKLGPNYLMPGVDFHFLQQTTLQLMRKDVIMISGHFAAAVAHTQAWHEIVASNLPYAIIFEDDVEIDPRIKDTLIKWMPQLPLNWSILYLDYSPEHHWPPPLIADNISEICPQVLSNAVDEGIVKLNGLCSSGSTRALVVSHHGARILHKEAIPIWRNADVFMRDLIYSGVIDAYVLIPSAVTGKMAFVNQSASQINLRSIKWTDSEVSITHKVGDDINCKVEMCNFRFRET